VHESNDSIDAALLFIASALMAPIKIPKKEELWSEANCEERSSRANQRLEIKLLAIDAWISCFSR
jgi:hypothetical protein